MRQGSRASIALGLKGAANLGQGSVSQGLISEGPDPKNYTVIYSFGFFEHLVATSSG